MSNFDNFPNSSSCGKKCVDSSEIKVLCKYELPDALKDLTVITEWRLNDQSYDLETFLNGIKNPKNKARH